MKAFIKKLIINSGKLLEKRFYQKFKIEEKGKRDIVTKVDKEIEKVIVREIKKKFPEHAILAEEEGKIGKAEQLWIIDPLDGTKNFASHIPFFNISIAYYECNQPIFAFVYNPILRELFFAEKDKGAYLNNKKIHVSEKRKLSESFVAFCRGLSDKAISRSSKIYSKLSKKVLALRQLGSAELELCYVGAGRIDAFYSNDFSKWDVASGFLIVSEAGGKITDFKGKNFNLKNKDIVASNGKIHSKLLKYLNKV